MALDMVNSAFGACAGHSRQNSWTGSQGIDPIGSSLTPPVPPWAAGTAVDAATMGMPLVERRLSGSGGSGIGIKGKLVRRSLSAGLERRLSVGHLYAGNAAAPEGNRAGPGQLQAGGSSSGQSCLIQGLITILRAVFFATSPYCQGL